MTNRKGFQSLKTTAMNIDIAGSKLQVACVKGTTIQVAVRTVVRTAAK
jgi:hypothetical protein